jgi:hypothetical protein
MKSYITVFIIALALVFSCPGFAAAGYSVLNKYKIPAAKYLPDCMGPAQQASSIHLESEDQRRLELARAFTLHLQNKGQDSSVVASIYKASLRTGVDFELLLLKAIMESDLGRLTVAEKSTARGVFQYIEPTWLTLIKRYGAELGYPHYAEAIYQPKHAGVPMVSGDNQYLKAEILALRHDPDISALVKAYQIHEETDIIRALKHGKVTAADHYITHMLGLPLARELYTLKDHNSVFALAHLGKPGMREAARLNKMFFYDGARPLTAGEVYARFENRVDREFRKIRQRGAEKPLLTCTASK